MTSRTPKANRSTSQNSTSSKPRSSNGVHRTSLQNLAPLPAFVPLASGGYVVSEPLKDASTGLYARLSYGDLESLAARYGGRLLTMAQVFEIWRDGYRIKPCTLVHKKSDFALMQGIEFARRHDECVRAQLAEWDGKKPLANAGKDWIHGAKKPGMARNGGWVTGPASAIQPGGDGSEHHDKSYTDYSQLARFWVPNLNMVQA
jgi:hypothetical protein